jgi:muramoyltetrapeptide carboxypeptidase
MFTPLVFVSVGSACGSAKCCYIDYGSQLLQAKNLANKVTNERTNDESWMAAVDSGRARV